MGQSKRCNKISLLSVDCDIYSSTVDIFNSVGHLLDHGSYVIFDELIGCRGWRDHEYKAFLEFIEQTHYEYEYLSYGLTYAMVRLK